MQSGEPVRMKSVAQGLVEAAFVLPVIVLLLVVAVDFGRFMHAHTALEAGVREGARVASNANKTDADIRSAVQTATPNYPISSGNISISVAESSRPTAHGTPVTITASTTVPIITPGAARFLSPTVTETARMVIM